MDREQEKMQFLGLYGIYKESYKIILSSTKIFSQITLTLILPLSFIFLIRTETSDVLLGKILHDSEEITETKRGSPHYDKLTNMISTEWDTFLLFKLLDFIIVLILSLLPTSAVVYTIASIYTSREVTFSKVVRVVPRVWKRLMLTFLCTFFAFFIYNVMALAIIIMWALSIRLNNGWTDITFVALMILYLAGFVHLAVVWQLASVVSLLEDSYGFEAMMKSKELIKGKMGLSIFIFLKFNVSCFVIQFCFMMVDVQGWKLFRMRTVDRIVYGIQSFLALSYLFLFGLVIQTVLYFVCKSYHHQNIDKSVLSDHLEVYLGEYDPLKAKDIQLDQDHV